MKPKTQTTDTGPANPNEPQWLTDGQINDSQNVSTPQKGSEGPVADSALMQL